MCVNSESYKMKNPIIALDFPNYEETEHFISRLPQDEPLFLKVGMELFYVEGPRLVSKLKEKGHSLFLDLKLYDIPNTVKSAMIGLAKMGVDMVNVHAAGGIRMMEAALEGLMIGSGAGKRPILIAVTQLTSMTEQEMQQSQGLTLSLLDSVIHFSKLTHQAGLDGVVCSPIEARHVKDAVGQDFLCVTPGIRLSQDQIDDQRRIMTPQQAKQNGASYIVVGRSITQSNYPKESYLTIKQQWESA